MYVDVIIRTHSLLSVSALYEHCGGCINIHSEVVKNGTLLSHGDAREKSHVVFPVFTQGIPHNMNLSKPLLTIPLVQLHGAMFIVKGKVWKRLVTLLDR